MTLLAVLVVSVTLNSLLGEMSSLQKSEEHEPQTTQFQNKYMTKY